VSDPRPRETYEVTVRQVLVAMALASLWGYFVGWVTFR
jgi:hypothetical protein